MSMQDEQYSDDGSHSIDNIRTEDGSYEELDNWYSSTSIQRVNNALKRTPYTPHVYEDLMNSESEIISTETTSITIDPHIGHNTKELELDSTSDNANHPAPAREASLLEGNDIANDALLFSPTMFLKHVKLPVDRAGTTCCDRCQSDLNRKLIVRCAMCAFTRHLYCFTPPLKQHPALMAVTQLPRHERPAMSQLIAKWTCESCTNSLQGVSHKDKGVRGTASGTKRTIIQTVKIKKRKSMPSTTSPMINNEVPLIQSDKPYNWHRFREEKYNRLRLLAESSTRDEPTASPPSELVYYSSSEALLKKTVAFWQYYAQRKHQLQLQNTTQTLKCRRPSQRSIMRSDLNVEEQVKLTLNSQIRALEAQEEEMLLDDALVYPWNDTRPIFETLRRRIAPVVEVIETSLESNSLSEQNNPFAQTQNEIERMTREDEDALTPQEAHRMMQRRIAQQKLARQKMNQRALHLAASIIQRMVVMWLYRSKRIVRATHKKVAMHNLVVLQSVMHFILGLKRALKRVKISKELRAALDRANELKQQQLQIRRQHLAEEAVAMRRRHFAKIVLRFFLKRVKHYIDIRKNMMVCRIQRWWKTRWYPFRWRILAIEVRQRHRYNAACLIQHEYRQYRVYHSFRKLIELNAIQKLRRLLRGWLMQRLARRERERLHAYHAADALGLVGDLEDTAELHEILLAMGVGLYEQSDFSNASLVLERVWRRKKEAMDTEAMLALAYSHHMAWYTSCDTFQLNQAYALYRIVLDAAIDKGKNVKNKEQVSGIPDMSLDPFTLQDVALVLMQREEFIASLRVFGQLIERFPTDEGFSLWLLLAGVQLQQVGQWEESVSYLSYVSDFVLPQPYVERDVLALCAIGYEHIKRRQDKVTSSTSAAKEAWKAAIRLWTLDKKRDNTIDGWQLYQQQTSLTIQGSMQNARRKWELLIDLGERACKTGHYLVSCRALLYALEHVSPSMLATTQHEVGDVSISPSQLVPSSTLPPGLVAEEQRAWWQLGDAFRHLGHLDLYVETTMRSRPPDSVTNEDMKEWRSFAEQEQTKFEKDLKSATIMQAVNRILMQYNVTTGEEPQRASDEGQEGLEDGSAEKESIQSARGLEVEDMDSEWDDEDDDD